jgi:hypothetical protein
LAGNESPEFLSGSAQAHEEQPHPSIDEKTIAPAFMLRGAVRDVQDRDVSGATVSLWRSPGWASPERQFYGQATTRSDGRFEVQVALAGRSHLVVQACSPEGRSLQTPVVAEPGGTSGETVLRLLPLARLNVTIVRDDGATPAFPCRVGFASSPVVGVACDQWIDTDALGSCRADVPFGPCAVVALGPDGLRAGRFHLVREGRLHLSLRLPAKGREVSIVVSPRAVSGTSADGAGDVEALLRLGGSSDRFVVPASGGTFTRWIAGSDTDRCEITLSAPGEPTIRWAWPNLAQALDRGHLRLARDRFICLRLRLVGSDGHTGLPHFHFVVDGPPGASRLTLATDASGHTAVQIPEGQTRLVGSGRVFALLDPRAVEVDTVRPVVVAVPGFSMLAGALSEPLDDMGPEWSLNLESEDPRSNASSVDSGGARQASIPIRRDGSWSASVPWPAGTALRATATQCGHVATIPTTLVTGQSDGRLDWASKRPVHVRVQVEGKGATLYLGSVRLLRLAGSAESSDGTGHARSEAPMVASIEPATGTATFLATLPGSYEAAYSHGSSWLADEFRPLGLLHVPTETPLARLVLEH